jgi:hypothetical protein
MKKTAGGLRADLIALLEKNKGLEDRPSKVAGGSAIFFREKEIAHFHNDNEIDVRLTSKVIRAEGLEHPRGSKFHAARAKGSQWIELQFHSPEDLPEIARLFKLALKQY